MLSGKEKRCGNSLLQIQILYRLIEVAGWRRRVTCPAGEVRGGFIDFEIDSRVMLHANHAEKNADGLGRIAGATYNLAHVVRMHVESHENAHLIHGPFYLHIVGVTDKRLHHDDVKIKRTVD